MMVKTGFMVGLGEEQGEIVALLQDLKVTGVNMLTIGQYLAPTMGHYPVKKYYTQEEFDHWAKLACDMGFMSVASGPLVRSSYHAGDYYREIVKG